MKGSYTIKVHNHRVTSTVFLERNITVICGDSGTGKTTLINSLLFYEELGEKSGVTIESKRPCRVLRGTDWYEKLQKISGCIVFADEGNEFVGTREFARAIQGSDNYYVLVTRENLFQLPYSVNSILELKKTKSRFRHTYNRTYPVYDRVDRFNERKALLDLFITEDTNAGNEMFSLIASKNGIECIAADGKNDLLPKAREIADKRIMLIADGAAFGANMAAVYQFLQLHSDRIILYLPESFEWLILSSGIIEDEETKRILSNPSEYIDGRSFLSWERYFTELLKEKTRGTIAEYSKNKLNPYYMGDDKVDKVENVIEQNGNVK